MSHKKRMQEQLSDSKTAPYLRFATAYKPKLTVHYILCESKDDIIFYSHKLRQLDAGVPFHFVPCNGKQLTRLTRKKIRDAQGYDNSRISSIVDADHGPFLNDHSDEPSEYITELYSVENYLVSKATFVEFLLLHSGLQNDDPAIEAAEAWFEELHQVFIENMKAPIALSIAARRLGGPNAVKLSDYEMRDFFRIMDDLKFVVLNCLTAAINEQVVENQRDEVAAECAAIEKELTQARANVWLRGKYLAWWFCTAFEKIKLSLARRNDQHGAPIRINCVLGSKQFISMLTAHVAISPQFSEFIIARVKGQLGTPLQT